MVYLLFLIFAGLAFADTQAGVVRSGNQAIPGAAVTVECGTTHISTVTDETGHFEVGGLTAGTQCRFSVGMFGFDAARQEAAPSTTALSFDLQLQRRATLPGERPQGPGRGGFGGRGGFAGRGAATPAAPGPGRG